MRNRSLVRAAGLLAAFVLVTAASGLEIRRTRTAAAIVQRPTGAQFIRVNFTAELANNSIPNAMREKVEVGWQEVGGISPQPFRILIPAGCFVANRGFHVEDFRRCGVQIAFGRSLQLLPVMDFEARIVPRDDGTHRFDLEALVVPPDPIHTLLGALGGAAVDIALGTQVTRSLPVSAATVSGISPDPF